VTRVRDIVLVRDGEWADRMARVLAGRGHRVHNVDAVPGGDGALRRAARMAGPAGVVVTAVPKDARRGRRGGRSRNARFPAPARFPRGPRIVMVCRTPRRPGSASHRRVLRWGDVADRFLALTAAEADGWARDGLSNVGVLADPVLALAPEPGQDPPLDPDPSPPATPDSSLVTAPESEPGTEPAAVPGPAFGSVPGPAFGSVPESAFGSVPESAFGSVPEPASERAPESASEPAPDPGRVVVSTAGPAHRHGLDLLLEAWADVSPRHPGWWLRLPECPASGEPLRQAERLGVTDTVEFGGGRASGALATAAVFAHPGRTRAYPVGLAQAMAYGVPAVAYGCSPGVRELITDGVNGMIVPTGNVGAFAKALDRVLGAEEFRGDLGRAARETARGYEPEVIGRRWDRLLRLLFR
jgi:glycosyltransferase involved in cell wall biosynthesis